MDKFHKENRIKYFETAGCRQSNNLVQINSSSTNNAPNYKSVEDIIQKYTRNNKINNEHSSSFNLIYRNIGNHALLAGKVDFSHSKQNYGHNDKKNEPFKYKSGTEKLSTKVLNNCTSNSTQNKFIHSTYKDCGESPKYIHNMNLTSNEKMYHDKTTYCRPVLNYYNEQFLYKTMERNARLKRLVRRLAIVRQREKETVSWNNYINELKNKHGLNYHDRKQTLSTPDEPDDYVTPDIINDYYKTRFSCEQSGPCKYLLQDFYESYDELSNINYYQRRNENITRQPEIHRYLPLERNSNCYSTSSQGTLKMNKEKQAKQSLNKHQYKSSDKNGFKNQNLCTARLDSSSTEVQKKSSTNNKNTRENIDNALKKTSSVQTNTIYYPHFLRIICQDKSTNKSEDSSDLKQCENTEKIKKPPERPLESNNCLQQPSLINIDIKLETLIESINTFIDKIKSSKASRRKKIKTISKDVYVNLNGNQPVKEKKTLSEVSTNISESRLKFPSFNNYLFQSSTEINQILQDIDNNKSRSILRDIDIPREQKRKDKPCSMHITFEVPTKDISTEVTRSLSEQESTEDKKVVMEEINTDGNLQRMTIAINTDPISLFGLLRFSTDTIKRLLSYMPNIDYYSYLSLLQFTHPTKNVESHYVCNICGADFNRPSQLSEHIQNHNLGETRDCCVCRHVLDTSRKIPGLFRCKYCGQLFTRAYCCELHQESCAKRFGEHHDVGSSLVLLR